MNTVEITKDELVGEPHPHILAMGKNVITFNIKESAKTINLTTGKKFDYQDNIYEIMNCYVVQAKTNYVKFNCIEKS